MGTRATLWWKALPRQNRRWLIVNAVAGAAVINLVVNACLAWIGTVGLRRVPFWSIPILQKSSIVSTTLGTFFILPLTTCLFCTQAVRVEQRRRGLPGVQHRFTERLPRHPLRRGVALGTLALASLSPIAGVIFVLAHVGGVGRYGFVVYAAVLGVCLGLFVTPVVALLAMGDQTAPAAFVDEPGSSASANYSS